MGIKPEIVTSKESVHYSFAFEPLPDGVKVYSRKNNAYDKTATYGKINLSGLKGMSKTIFLYFVFEQPIGHRFSVKDVQEKVKCRANNLVSRPLKKLCAMRYLKKVDGNIKGCIKQAEKILFEVISNSP